MKQLLLLFLFALSFNATAQINCDEYITALENDYPQEETHEEFNSVVIHTVTFYTVNYEKYDYIEYYAVVVFQSNRNKKYIYRVGRYSAERYLFDHWDDAGRAFYEHIHIYNDRLDCGNNY